MATIALFLAIPTVAAARMLLRSRVLSQLVIGAELRTCDHRSSRKMSANGLCSLLESSMWSTSDTSTWCAGRSGTLIPRSNVWNRAPGSAWRTSRRSGFSHPGLRGICCGSSHCTSCTLESRTSCLGNRIPLLRNRFCMVVQCLLTQFRSCLPRSSSAATLPLR